MNRCPITYEECGNSLYSLKGLKQLSPGLKSLEIFPYTAQDQRREAFRRASKMSIQGVQPKLSSVLEVKNGRFKIVDRNGKYILKPQHQIYPELPENEDLSMRLAAIAGIEVPLHGLIYSSDNTFTYFIKRFDREGHTGKVPVEDFAQLAGMTRDTKYNYTMEGVAGLIDNFCTFPAIQKMNLFRRVIFNFLIGNEDMHLKNYSVITRDEKVELSPAYDLLNTSIVLEGDIEEIALPLGGHKNNLSYEVLVDYFGKHECRLTGKIIENILDVFRDSIPKWLNLVRISFLSAEMKIKYSLLINKRASLLNLV